MVWIIDVHGILLAIYTSEFPISGSLSLLSLGCLDRLLQLILQIVHNLEVIVQRICNFAIAKELLNVEGPLRPDLLLLGFVVPWEVAII